MASWGTYPGRLPTWADPNPLQSNSHGPAVTAVTALSDLCLEPEPRTGTECRPNFLGPPAPPQWEPRRSRYLVSPGRDPPSSGSVRRGYVITVTSPHPDLDTAIRVVHTLVKSFPGAKDSDRANWYKNCPGIRQGDGLTGGSETTGG